MLRRQVLLSTAFPVPSPSITVLSSFPFYLPIYEVFHFPAFFSWSNTSLQTHFLFVYFPLCFLGFLFTCLHSATHERSSLTCCCYLDVTSRINKMFLHRTTQKHRTAIPQLGRQLIITLIKATKEKKSKNFKEKSFWSSQKPRFAAKFGEDSRNIILLLGILTWKHCFPGTFCILFGYREE